MSRQKSNSDIPIIEPTYVFLTAYMTPSFKSHVNNMGVKLIYEKPIQKE
jgi:hypothetical protein